MSQYTPIYTKPYPDGWKDLPAKETPVTAEIMDAYDDVIENIENYLSENPIESGGGGDADLIDLDVENSISMGRIGDIGYHSVATGADVEASGYCSYAHGAAVISSGYCSSADGYFLIASSNYQHVEGKFNIEDSEGKYAHIVGGGNSMIDRKNIHALDWQGNAEYAGTVKSAGLKLTDTETGQEYIISIASGNLTITEVE